MTPDKFLTDLAFISKCDAVSVYYNQISPFDECFEVLFFIDNCMIVGTGPTVEAAMQEARAKLAAHDKHHRLHHRPPVPQHTST